jgi:hypothetical protein
METLSKKEISVLSKLTKDNYDEYSLEELELLCEKAKKIASIDNTDLFNLIITEIMPNYLTDVMSINHLIDTNKTIRDNLNYINDVKINSSEVKYLYVARIANRVVNSYNNVNIRSYFNINQIYNRDVRGFMYLNLLGYYRNRSTSQIVNDLIYSMRNREYKVFDYIYRRLRNNIPNLNTEDIIKILRMLVSDPIYANYFIVPNFIKRLNFINELDKNFSDIKHNLTNLFTYDIERNKLKNSLFKRAIYFGLSHKFIDEYRLYIDVLYYATRSVNDFAYIYKIIDFTTILINHVELVNYIIRHVRAEYFELIIRYGYPVDKLDYNSIELAEKRGDKEMYKLVIYYHGFKR